MSEKKYDLVAGGKSHGFPDPDGVLWLIRKYGIFGLGGSDGCYCCNFAVRGISVDVSCHKSEHCVRVHSRYLGFMVSELFDIANEVLSQLPSGGSGYRVRFCEYGVDHVNGRWERGSWVEENKCAYCGKPRDGAEAYLCPACLKNPDASHYDASGYVRSAALESEE